MNKYSSCISYLLDQKTNLIPHGNKSFFDHLLGTYNLLKKTGQEEDICFAGLFHSIYGNDVFDKKTETDREKIKDLIGLKAEELVWTFNSTPRTELEKNNTSEIKMLLLCNKLEQNTLFEIYDNLFDSHTLDTLYGEYRDYVPWRFIGAADETNQNTWRKFQYILNKKKKIDRILFKEAHNILRKNNLDKIVKFKRAYGNGNIYGTVHHFHEDDGAQNYNEVFTIMFYLNKEWFMHYGGETVFLTQDKNEIWKSVIPKPGRAILFDGFIPHAARELSRQCVELRMVVSFKYSVNNVRT
jgi:hypothetical protein